MISVPPCTRWAVGAAFPTCPSLDLSLLPLCRPLFQGHTPPQAQGGQILGADPPAPCLPPPAHGRLPSVCLPLCVSSPLIRTSVLGVQGHPTAVRPPCDNYTCNNPHEVTFSEVLAAAEGLCIYCQKQTNKQAATDSFPLLCHFHPPHLSVTSFFPSEPWDFSTSPAPLSLRQSHAPRGDSSFSVLRCSSPEVIFSLKTVQLFDLEKYPFAASFSELLLFSVCQSCTPFTVRGAP